MRVSDAIALGRTLVKPGDGTFWLHEDEGCACGMAMAAVGEAAGATSDDFYKHWPHHLWPEEIQLAPAGYISGQYRRVIIGEITMDQLIDFVRTIEPKEEDASEARNEQHEEVAVRQNPGVLSHRRHRGS